MILLRVISCMFQMVDIWVYNSTAKSQALKDQFLSLPKLNVSLQELFIVFPARNAIWCILRKPWEDQLAACIVNHLCIIIKDNSSPFQWQDIFTAVDIMLMTHHFGLLVRGNYMRKQEKMSLLHVENFGNSFNEYYAFTTIIIINFYTNVWSSIYSINWFHLLQPQMTCLRS